MLASFPRLGFACLLLVVAAALGACADDGAGGLAPVDYVVDDPRPGLGVEGGGRPAAERPGDRRPGDTRPGDTRPGLPVVGTAAPAAGEIGNVPDPPIQAAPGAAVERRDLPPPGKRDGPPAVEALPMAKESPPSTSAVPESAPQVTPPPAGETVVAEGETLSAVSRRTGVPLRALIEENRLTPPFILRPGDRLKLPGLRFHTVQAGDTVYNISRRYGVDQASLMQANGIAPPYTIRLGQALRVPSRIDAMPVVADGPAPVLVPVPATRPAAPPAAMPAVLSVAPGRLIPPAPAAPPGLVEEPDPDSLPPPKGAPLALGGAAVPPPPAVVPKPAATVTPPPARAAAPARGRFIWPVAGDVVSRYGPKPGGQHNDGINVQAAEGSTVRASDGGVVAYAGNEIRGYGNLVLIRHAEGWMSAYAHCRRLLVKKGDTVSRGQVIAEVGRTGNVTVPQLHFEIRRSGEALDPLTVLPGGA